MSEELPRERIQEIGGPQMAPQNANLSQGGVMERQLPDSGATGATVAEVVASHPKPDPETVRAEYREQQEVGAVALQGQQAGPGEMVAGRHETVAPLGPQEGTRPPEAPQQ